ncbi:uncharacterized protein LOC131657659 [Vicia villosa]|uniref:uncharacterized protein LOC131657659 n=1 Tax=Vicia villosa TaxID=3911 RepID=UPI00273C73FE|nr:uncharacterized protein LOC131657659 [Vicia villosa]
MQKLKKLVNTLSPLPTHSMLPSSLSMQICRVSRTSLTGGFHDIFVFKVISFFIPLMCNIDSDFLMQFPKKLLKGAIAVPLSEMKKIREITFCATVAKTRKLIASSHGWYFQCCHECTKSVRGDKPPYKCDNGHFTEAEIYKYKIEVEGFYLHTSCKFIFWDRECTEILHVSAAHMRDTMIKAGITDPLEFPLDLDAMLDLDLALRVKWQPGWDSASVIMFIKDDEFVKQLKAPWADTQIKESVDEAKTDVADDCDVPTDLEITSKHNPEPLTPTVKRQNHHGSSESTSVCDGELSSTKLKKIIKLENNNIIPICGYYCHPMDNLAVRSPAFVLSNDSSQHNITPTYHSLLREKTHGS